MLLFLTQIKEFILIHYNTKRELSLVNQPETAQVDAARMAENIHIGRN